MVAGFLEKANDVIANYLTIIMVDKRIKSLKGTAQPGSTRAKNTYFQLLTKSPRGLEVIRT